MGLAASQARFLGITARKSNIEYEGQQVNQQRTALAQEVNALYNKLLALDVPVAPDTTEFYETNYTFEVSNTSGMNGEYAIKKYYENEDGETYTVIADRSYTKQVAVGTLYKSELNPITQNEKGEYVINGIGDTAIVLNQMTPENSKSKIDLINASYPNADGTDKVQGEYLYSYTTGEGENAVVHYIDAYDVENASATYSTYISTEKDFKEREEFPNATISFDENGRMESINLDGETTLEVGTARMHNDEGYQKALRDYTMDKDEYDKMVADLNAQTEVLQQEDKVLELRLNQIDTEQKELDTELAAVKEVLKKNIESTFKTFA